ncbi:unnamed protein product [Mytilus coruscus]|uniref:B box-type domain-containing protein n=1 Tax=Mytilus coruscus TaxID=42192 RepID=A0A6J8BKK1_MYTCO|nr:unnamed protein product [Mytilus coruscus]
MFQAQHTVINNLIHCANIHDLERHSMAEGTTVSCEPCGYNGLSKSAKVWCNDCGEGFCDECVNGHKMTKILRSHHLLSITNYLKSAELFIDENCQHHKEPYEFFCLQHDTILCLECVQENHSRCKISKLSKVAKGSKTSTALTDLENDIKSTSEHFGKYPQEEDISKTDLKQQKQNIRDKVYNMRCEFNNHLDQLQENVLKDLELKYNNCTKGVNEFNSASQVKGDDIEALHNRIAIMKKYGSEKQVFIGTRQIGKILYKQKQELCKNLSKPKNFSLEFKMNGNAKSLLSDFKSFGEILVRESSETVTFIDPSKKQAQLNIQKHLSIEKIDLQLNQLVQITNPSGLGMSLIACAIFPTKQVVFANDQNNIIFHNEDGSFSGDIQLDDSIYDLTPINSDKIAVRTDYEVKLVDINTKKVERIITGCGNIVWGICYANGKLYVLDYGKIRIVDLDGTVSKYIPIETDNVGNVAVHNDQIYFIRLDLETVYVIDHSGNQLWTFHGNRLQTPECFLLQYSISLDVDNHGNVFIVLPDYDQVIVVSSDGKQHRVILDKSNNLKGPSGISYCRETDQLLVCNDRDGCATIYDINL